MTAMAGVRPWRGSGFKMVYEVINNTAEAYRGIVPPERWVEAALIPENATIDRTKYADCLSRCLSSPQEWQKCPV